MAVLPKELNEIVRAPEEEIQKNPNGLLELIGFYCEADFEIREDLQAAAARNITSLSSLAPDQLRSGLERVLVSSKAGQGLTKLIEIGAMDYILGEEITRHMTKAETDSLATYIENIDKTKQIRLRRLALLFLCFNPKKSEVAIDRLAFEEEDRVFLLDSLYVMNKMYFINNKYELKKFLVKYGAERYEFLQNLAKAQRIVYDLPPNRVVSRDYIMDNIKEFNEPIFEEDLAITRDDLREQGIGKELDYNRVFEHLLDLAHMKPSLNTKEDMLEYAEKYSKYKWAGALKKIKYIK